MDEDELLTKSVGFITKILAVEEEDFDEKNNARVRRIRISARTSN